MHRTGRIRALAALLVLANAPLGLAGCSTESPFPKVVQPVVTPLVANSPVNAVKVLQASYRNRSMDDYPTLFTDDFVFAFSPLDAAGNPYRGSPWSRADELLSARHLFVEGNSTEEPAASISLDYTNALADFADTRPGMRDRFHRQVDVGVVLVIRRSSSQLETQGDARFFLIRGDAASLPPVPGLAPDSTRWYIQRWEDFTVQSGAPSRLGPAGALGTQPANRSSWGQIKSLYR